LTGKSLKKGGSAKKAGVGLFPRMRGVVVAERPTEARSADGIMIDMQSAIKDRTVTHTQQSTVSHHRPATVSDDTSRVGVVPG